MDEILKSLILKDDVVKLSKYIKDNKLSLSDISWAMDCDNITSEKTNQTVFAAIDNIVGEFIYYKNEGKLCN